MEIVRPLYGGTLIRRESTRDNTSLEGFETELELSIEHSSNAFDVTSFALSVVLITRESVGTMVEALKCTVYKGDGELRCMTASFEAQFGFRPITSAFPPPPQHSRNASSMLFSS